MKIFILGCERGTKKFLFVFVWSWTLTAMIMVADSNELGIDSDEPKSGNDEPRP